MSYKIIAVLGDFYHKKEISISSLEHAIKSLKSENIEIEIEYQTIENIDRCLEAKPDAIILFAENRLNPQDEIVNTWMNDDVAFRISQYVEQGGSWLAWHSGMASYENVDKYVSLLHGYFKYHPVEHQIVQYIAEPGTPFAEVGQKFEFLDEHYFVECDEEKTNVFLRSHSIDGDSIAGWAHEYGKGRVVCLGPAHLEEGLMHPDFQAILKKSIEWSCRSLN